MEILEGIEEPLKNKEKYAGFWLRFIAYIIDELIFGFIGGLILIPFFLSSGIIFIKKAINNDFSEADIPLLLTFIFGFIGIVFILIIMKWLYYAIMESSKYQGTIGKMAIAIKVTDLKGEKISFARATGRFFAACISFMTVYIGYIIAGFTEKKQALHDMIASCLVIRKTN